MAAARGLALAGLMLAGLVLLAVIVTAVGLACVRRRAPHRGQRGGLVISVCCYSCWLFGAGLALGRFGAPAALLGIRRLASLTRRLAGEWCGVPIAEPRPPRARCRARAGSASPSGCRWLLTDRGPGGTCCG